MRVALKIFDEGAADLGLGPAFRRVGDALSEAHRLRLGLKVGRHRCDCCAAGGGRGWCKRSWIAETSMKASLEVGPFERKGVTVSGKLSFLRLASKLLRLGELQSL